MPDPDFDLATFLPYQLAVLARAVSTEFSKAYEQFGLSIPDWRVMAHLSQNEAVSVREISERADMDKPKVSRAAQRLEAAGLVTKITSDADRRLVKLSLSTKGRDLFAQITPVARAFEDDLDHRLGPEDAAAFRRAITKLIDRDTP